MPALARAVLPNLAHARRARRSRTAQRSSSERRADDAIIASKPVVVSSNPANNASKALLQEVRRALIPTGADAAKVLKATQRFQEAFEAGEDFETTVAKALG